MDFSVDTGNVAAGLCNVAGGILQHGVTSFCPTIVSSKPEVYQKVCKLRLQGFNRIIIIIIIMLCKVFCLTIQKVDYLEILVTSGCSV